MRVSLAIELNTKNSHVDFGVFSSGEHSLEGVLEEDCASVARMIGNIGGRLPWSIVVVPHCHWN